MLRLKMHLHQKKKKKETLLKHRSSANHVAKNGVSVQPSYFLSTTTKKKMPSLTSKTSNIITNHFGKS